ncbi:oligosaccharide flippase family protein [Rhodococcus fascians]|nr:oligosaccharide flippase family protein [Rhodococcus fascians]MBY4415169.1 oligosaccharide flippase family protein [Rhodococcus fascians]
MGSFLSGALKSGGARAVTLPVTAISSLVSSTVIISSAGVTGYAAISVVSTLFLLIQFSDLGLGSAVINEVASSSATDVSKASVIATAVRILCIVSVILLAIAYAGTSIFSWSDVLGVRDSSLTNLDDATLISVAIFAIALPLGLSQRVLVGLGKNHLAVYLSLATSISSVVIVFLISISHFPLAYMATAQSAGLLITNLLSTVVVRRSIFFKLSMVWQRSRFSTSGVLGAGLWMLLLTITLALSFQIGRIMLSHRSTQLNVAYFSLAMQFYLPAVSIVSAAGFSLWPMFARDRSVGSAAIGSFTRILLAFAGLGFFLAACFAILARPVGRLVSGGEISLPASLVFFCALAIFLQAIQIVPGMMLTSPNGLRFQACCGVLCAAVSITLSYFLAPIVGSSAPMIATCWAIFLTQIVPCLTKSYVLLRNPSL